MKETYTVQYREPGRWTKRTLKNIKGDGVEGLFRFFQTEDDELVYIDARSWVKFPKERQAIITHKMSRDIGQPVQRA